MENTDRVELSEQAESALLAAYVAARELASITDESWGEAVSGLNLSDVEKSSIESFTKRTKTLRDELNRILIIEEPEYDMRTGGLGGMPPVAQAKTASGYGLPTYIKNRYEAENGYANPSPLNYFYGDQNSVYGDMKSPSARKFISLSEDGEDFTLSAWVSMLRHALHKLAPELDGSNFGVKLSRLLAGVDSFEVMAPDDLLAMELKKNDDGATNGTSAPGEMSTAGQNVVITPDLNAGGKLVPAQGGKVGGPFERKKYKKDVLKDLTDKDLGARDEELHVIFEDNFAANEDTEKAGLKRVSILNAHQSVVDEHARRKIEHEKSDALSKETKSKTKKFLGCEIQILKADTNAEEDERFVLGVVLEPNDGADEAPLDPDAQKDIYSAEDIRQTAHMFMADFQQIGLMHEQLISRGVRILESYIAPVAFEMDGQNVRKGSWLLALRILSDEVWEDIKLGKLTGFSIGGDAVRSKLAKS